MVAARRIMGALSNQGFNIIVSYFLNHPVYLSKRTVNGYTEQSLQQLTNVKQKHEKFLQQQPQGAAKFAFQLTG